MSKLWKKEWGLQWDVPYLLEPFSSVGASCGFVLAGLAQHWHGIGTALLAVPCWERSRAGT